MTPRYLGSTAAKMPAIRQCRFDWDAMRESKTPRRLYKTTRSGALLFAVGPVLLCVEQAGIDDLPSAQLVDPFCRDGAVAVDGAGEGTGNACGGIGIAA